MRAKKGYGLSGMTAPGITLSTADEVADTLEAWAAGIRAGTHQIQSCEIGQKLDVTDFPVMKMVLIVGIAGQQGSKHIEKLREEEAQKGKLN